VEHRFFVHGDAGILSDDKLYILNHISLERVFNYRDKYLQATNEAMGELLNKAVIANMEQFADDCTVFLCLQCEQIT